LLLLRARSTHVSSAQQAAVVAGLTTFGALSTAYVTHAASLIAARQAGILKRWRATPVPPWCFFAGRIAATALLAATGGLLTAAIGGWNDRLALSAAGLAELAGILLLGAGVWASVGTAVSALIPTVESAWPLLGLTSLPVVILSGSFGSVSKEPGWLTTVIAYLPVQPVIHAASNVLHAGGGPLMSMHDLGVLLAWAAGGLLVSQRYFRWEPHRPGRRRADRRAAATPPHP